MILPYTVFQNIARVLPELQAMFCKSFFVTSVHKALYELRKLNVMSRITLSNTLSISQFIIFQTWIYFICLLCTCQVQDFVVVTYDSSFIK